MIQLDGEGSKINSKKRKEQTSILANGVTTCSNILLDPNPDIKCKTELPFGKREVSSQLLISNSFIKNSNISSL